MTTLQEAARKALAQQELPQKERPDFMAGYDAGMADAKRMAQQGEQQQVSWRDEIKVLADVYAAKVSEFARSLALAKEDDSMSPVSAAAGDARMALHEAIDTHAERIKELEAVNKLLSGIQENTEEENRKLRAQLDAIAATEPVAYRWVWKSKPWDIEGWCYTSTPPNSPELQEIEKLFTRPMPAQDVTEFDESQFKSVEYLIAYLNKLNSYRDKTRDVLSKYKGAK